MLTVEQEIKALSLEDLKTLRMRWERLHHAPCPHMLSRDLLTRMITYKLREQAYGGFRPAVRRKIKALVEQLDKQGDAAFEVTPTLRSGSRLIREWRNKTYVVHVKSEGFECQNRHYTSLSEIAREITGARWSGPRFFGLVKSRKTVVSSGEVDHG
ncbi:MAG: DUF2924 domain-containing protein [Paraperlucidibaca sp.]|nr:DUF2924 domain-containing protein [Paraperlucidibaca sp.]